LKIVKTVFGEYSMIVPLKKYTICPQCGSTEYTIDYVAGGLKTCKKCKHKMETIILKEPELDNSDNCPFCRKEPEEDEEVPVKKDGIMVYKCKHCGELYGYLIWDDYDRDSCLPFNDVDPDNGQYNHKEVKIAEQEGSHVLSASKNKEIAKTIKKQENSPKEKCKKHLLSLVREKNENLKTARIAPETIRKATAKVEDFINKKGEQTDKQLMSLFYASIYVIQDAQIRSGKTTTPNLTERTLQETFGIDRKTIRKWKKVFKENLTYPKFNIGVHNANSFEPHTIADVSEIKSIIKIETPKTGNCDSCERPEALNWRIEYLKNSWSEICQSCSDRLGPDLYECNWQLKIPSSE